MLIKNATPGAEFHRVAFGLIAPSGTDDTQMRWVGCNTPYEGDNERACVGGVGFGTTTFASQSWTVGPDASPAGTQLPHTLYVVLEGNRPSQASLLTLNPENGPGTYVLGSVELDGSPDLEPALTVDGVTDVDDRQSPGTPVVPFELADFSAPVPTQVRLIGAFNPADDVDGDGIQDLGDNCPFSPNPAQTNRGSFLDSTDDSDALGDACQCAESSDDGAVLDPDDFDDIRDYLAGRITKPRRGSRDRGALLRRRHHRVQHPRPRLPQAGPRHRRPPASPPAAMRRSRRHPCPRRPLAPGSWKLPPRCARSPDDHLRPTPNWYPADVSSRARLASLSLLLAGLLALSGADPARAQTSIVLDGSLPHGRTDDVSGTQPGPTYEVGEALGWQVGGNLFHSFSLFSVGAGDTATFTEDPALNAGLPPIGNVIARVTSGNVSAIDGVLRSEIPNSNFFLLNPAGVIFGGASSLDLPGSLTVSTAQSLVYTGGSEALSTTVLDDPVLLAAEPAAFGFLGGTAAADVLLGNPDPNVAKRLRVADGATFTIVAGNVRIENNTDVQAFGGRVQVAAVGSAAAEVPTDLAQWNVAPDGNAELGEVSVENQSALDTLPFDANVAQGTVVIRGGRFELLDRSLVRGGDRVGGTGAAVDVQVARDVEVRDRGELRSEGQGAITSGGVHVSAQGDQLGRTGGGALARLRVRPGVGPRRRRCSRRGSHPRGVGIDHRDHDVSAAPPADRFESPRVRAPRCAMRRSPPRPRPPAAAATS